MHFPIVPVLALAVSGLAAGTALAGSHASPEYPAKELMQICVEADNDSRFGQALEIECEQYMLGFIQALAVTGMAGDGTEICPPAQNLADEVRWAYTRWIHGDYSKRVQLSAADALLATLKDEFACGG